MKAVSTTITVQQISDSYDSRIVLSQGYQRLYDALQLLQADPSVKVSLLTFIASFKILKNIFYLLFLSKLLTKLQTLNLNESLELCRLVVLALVI